MDPSDAMPDNESPRIMKEQTESGYVVIPYSGDQFRDFIKSLLGSPQSITRSIDVPFEIDAQDIRSLNDLIMQRVTQQNHGILAQFVSRTGLSDGSAIEMQSIEQFLSYNEIRPVATRSVTLQWIFLIQFQDKEIPERQTLKVSFYIDSPGLNLNPDGSEENRLYRRLRMSDTGLISFRIEHTARTWGADIEALLSHHLKSFVKSESKLKTFLINNRSRVGPVVAGSIIFSSVIGVILTTIDFTARQVAEAKAVSESNPGSSLGALSQKVNYLASYLSSGIWPHYFMNVIIFLILTFLLAESLSYWASFSAGIRIPSFILLSRYDDRRKKEHAIRMSNKVRSIIGSIVVALFLGVLSNVVFNLLFR